MAYEIIYVCNSTNNKNIRRGELNILEKHENQLCFEFGVDRMNIKKRFYNDVETLNKDFDALMKLKEKESKEKGNKTLELVKEMNENIKIAYQEPEKVVAKEIKKEAKKTPKEEKTDKYKIIKRKK
jgi:uncharacterized protein YuzE